MLRHWNLNPRFQVALHLPSNSRSGPEGDVGADLDNLPGRRGSLDLRLEVQRPQPVLRDAQPRQT